MLPVIGGGGGGDKGGLTLLWTMFATLKRPRYSNRAVTVLKEAVFREAM